MLRMLPLGKGILLFDKNYDLCLIKKEFFFIFLLNAETVKDIP